ncbi:MAG TPA: VWA domain-containing protein, partial [Thermoanaerobaculia bacterium]|nr:VWA domain-containing protein [Thermoanaerobaculia bacterium]
EQRLYLTVFFDNQSLIPPARNRIIASLKDFVRTQVKPDDNVMIVSYEGAGSMKVRQVSGGPEPLVKALDEVAKESTGGMDRQMAFREVMRTLDGTQTIGRGSAQDNTLASAEAAAAAVRAFGEARHNEIRNSLKALGGFVDGLSGLPGRKALLYVSGGNSLRPAETLYESWLNRFGALAGRQVGVNSLTGYQNDLTTRFREIGERANANRVTFYTLGATSVPATDTAETASADSAWTRDQEVREIQNLTQSLLLVAAPTGGLASIDPTEPGVFLRQMREDFEHFYSLGYAPADRKTPGTHKIEVRVKRPGLKVRHREGYRDRTTRDRLNHQAMAALLFGSGDDNPLEVGVLVEAERPAKRRKQREISLLVTIPMANLVLLPQEKVHTGRVTLLLGARDDEGRSSDLTQIDIPVRVPEAQLATAKDQSVAYRATLALRDGRHTVVVGVRDEYGNVNSTLTFAYGEAAKRARSGR